MGKSKPKKLKERIFTSWLTSMVSITLVLFLLGLLVMILFNAGRLSDYVREKIGFTLVLREDLPGQEIDKLQKALTAEPWVKSLRYIDKESAAKELETELEKLQETITELKRVKELTLNIQRKWNEKIEEKANSLFSLVKWKLFEVQKNDEIADICEAMIDGIGYRETLNTGNKIMACVDLSNTFSEHFGREYPLFLDNAEAVTKWKIKPVNQHILLKAVEGIDKLKTTFI